MPILQKLLLTASARIGARLFQNSLRYEDLMEIIASLIIDHSIRMSFFEPVLELTIHLFDEHVRPLVRSPEVPSSPVVQKDVHDQLRDGLREQVKKLFERYAVD